MRVKGQASESVFVWEAGGDPAASMTRASADSADYKL